MADIVTPEKRSEMMSGIRGKDTKPELVIRSGLHRMGYRFRLHAKDLPGKPDLVFPKYKAVIFVHGCFWHGHDCELFVWPKTRSEFWRKKIMGNRERDVRNREALIDAGWRVFEVWECTLKGRLRLPRENVIDNVARWLRGKAFVGELRGTSSG